MCWCTRRMCEQEADAKAGDEGSDGKDSEARLLFSTVVYVVCR